MCCCIPCCCCCCIPTIIRFIISVAFATFFTVIALFTPGWGYLDTSSCDNFWNRYTDTDLSDLTIGLITNRHSIATFAFEKYCAAAMFLTILCFVAVFILYILSFFNIKHVYMPPTMIVLSGIATFWLLTVAIVYPVKFGPTYKSKFGDGDICNQIANAYDTDISFTPSYSYGLAVWSLVISIIANIYGFVMLNEIYGWRNFSNYQNQGWGFSGWNNSGGNANMNQGNMNWNGNQNMQMGNMGWKGGNQNMGPGYYGGNMNQGNMNYGGNSNMGPGNMNYGGNPNTGPGNMNYGGNPNMGPGNMNMQNNNPNMNYQGMGNPC